MEKNKEKKETVNKDQINQLLEHQDVKPKIDAEIEKRSEEKSKLLFKRNEFLNTVDNDPLSSLEKYRTVDEDGYFDLRNTIKETKSNISKSSIEDLSDIENRLKSAMKIEENLKRQLNSFSNTPVAVEKVSTGVPEGLEEILKNPEIYKEHRIQYIDRGDKTFSLYETKLDHETVDLGLLGNRTDKLSVKEMNRLENSLEDTLTRNARFKHFQTIE